MLLLLLLLLQHYSLSLSIAQDLPQNGDEFILLERDKAGELLLTIVPDQNERPDWTLGRLLNTNQLNNGKLEGVREREREKGKKMVDNFIHRILSKINSLF